MKEYDLGQAKVYINSIDFSRITDKMVRSGGWMQEDVIETCQLYRNFLYLKKKYGDEYNLPPSIDMDEFWHNHILDTKKYIEDCLIIFGEYLHHYPYFGIDGKTTEKEAKIAFEATQEFYVKEFGSQIHATRSRFYKPVYHLLHKIYS